MFTKNKVLTLQKAIKKKIKTSNFFVIKFSGCNKVVQREQIKKENH